MQVLDHIIANLEQRFINKVSETEDIAQLQQLLKRTRSADRRILIKARIENLNHKSI